MNKVTFIAACTLVVAGCSNDAGKAEIKQILECSMAAKLVGRSDQIDRISEHSNMVSARTGYRPGYDEVKEMHAEIKAGWNLKALPRYEQDVLLVGVYNSQACRAIHKSDPMRAEDVPPDA